MDEPFGALDAQTRVVMQEELVRLARRNPRTVLFITHAVEEAVYLADRVAIMTRRPGRIKEVLDIRSIREAENWDRHSRIEDVMDLESFVHLRTHIWKSLREEKGAQGVGGIAAIKPACPACCRGRGFCVERNDSPHPEVRARSASLEGSRAAGDLRPTVRGSRSLLRKRAARSSP
jgi:hypothetical protein